VLGEELVYWWLSLVDVRGGGGGGEREREKRELSPNSRNRGGNLIFYRLWT
jgi:hypothetical protein